MEKKHATGYLNVVSSQVRSVIQLSSNSWMAFKNTSDKIDLAVKEKIWKKFNTKKTHEIVQYIFEIHNFDFIEIKLW